MKHSTHQQGSAHVVIVICLVLALLTALGWIFWQNFVHKEEPQKETDVVVVEKEKEEAKTEEKTEQQPSEYAPVVPEGWVTKSVAGVSFAVPGKWLTTSCDGRCSVEVKKHKVDQVITPMVGPHYPVRYSTSAKAWQTIDPYTNKVFDEKTVKNIVKSIAAKAENKYSAWEYTSGDGMMAQTHVLVVKGKTVYQLALPVTVDNSAMVAEKKAELPTFVKTIKF